MTSYPSGAIAADWVALVDAWRGEAPLSNGNVSLLVDMAKHAGLPWDTVFGSDVFGHFKPVPETYLGAARLLDLKPGEVMMAAAHNNDLKAAQKLGLMTAFFARPAEYGPHQIDDLEAMGTWDLWPATSRIWLGNWTYRGQGRRIEKNAQSLR